MKRAQMEWGTGDVQKQQRQAAAEKLQDMAQVREYPGSVGGNRCVR